MIDISPRDLETVERILAKRVPGSEVRAFGSRASWTAKSASDLDLAIVGDKEISRRTLTQLKADFEDSALPFTVDVLDWHKISPEFQQNISNQYEIIQDRQSIKKIPEGWRYLKVSEFAEIIGGGTPSTKLPEYWNDDIPWLTPKDMSDHQGRYICCGKRNISQLGLENSSAKLVPTCTVLLTSRAPVGYVAIAKNPLTTNQGFRSLIVKDSFYNEFIYYLFLHNTEYLRQHATGSTFLEISGSTLKGLEFLIPPFAEQRAIARILGDLDNKIELNRQINQSLEQIAQAIFKSWFVDFDPVKAKIRAKEQGRDPERAAMEAIAGKGVLQFTPTEQLAATAALFPDELIESELGLIPKGWYVKLLKEFINIKHGYAFKGEFFKEEPTNNILLTPGNFKIGGGFKFHKLKYYEGPIPEDYVLSKGDLLLTMTDLSKQADTLGYPAFVPYLEQTKFLHNQRLGKVVYKEGFDLDSYFCSFFKTQRYRSEIVGGASGSTVKHTAPKKILAVKIPFSGYLEDAFNKLTGSINEKANQIFEEIIYLETLRDSLLPKLLTGDLLVKQMERTK